MDQSEEDKQQLADLAARRDSGEITEKQYQQLLWDRLKRNRRDSGSISPEHLSMLDTRDNAPNVEQELIPQLPIQPLGEALSGTFSDSGLSGAGSSGSYHRPSLNKPIASYHQKKNRLNNLFIFSGVFVLGLGLAVIIGLFKRHSGHLPTTANPAPTPDETTQPDPTVEVESKVTFIQPMFGHLAIDQCRQRCQTAVEQAVQPACIRSCRRLSFAHFGRRILIKEVSASDVGKTLVARCRDKVVDNTPHISGSNWERSASQALTALQQASSTSQMVDSGGQRQNLQLLLDSNRNLKMPPGGTAEEIAVTELLLRATCLRTHLLLSEIAISTAQQERDEYSKKFFTGVRNVVLPLTIDFEGKTLSKASSLRLASY